MTPSKAATSQAVKDALADAETLRHLYEEVRPRSPVCGHLTWAANLGGRTVDALAGRNIECAGAVTPYEGARGAAHHAFLAVPGLRASR